MKSSMKKLAVFVMMAAIAMFIVVVTASAGDRDRDGHHKGIIGEYGFSATNNCTSTPDPNWLAPAPDASPLGTVSDPTKVWANNAHAHGVLTFKHDGTGMSDGYALQTPPNISPATSNGAPLWGAAYFHVTYPFTYTVTDDGEITITADSNAYKQEQLGTLTGKPSGVVYTRDKYSLTGWVSADHKTMTLANPKPEVVTITVTFPGNPPPAPSINKAICHYSWVAVRLDE